MELHPSASSLDHKGTLCLWPCLLEQANHEHPLPLQEGPLPRAARVMFHSALSRPVLAVSPCNLVVQAGSGSLLSPWMHSYTRALGEAQRIPPYFL